MEEYSEDVIQQIWEKATVPSGFDGSLIRRDPCGAWIMRNCYGDHDQEYGWEIDHILPKVLGGDNSLDNLRPMQWQNVDAKGDSYPSYESVICSDGYKNIEFKKRQTINVDLRQRLEKRLKIQPLSVNL